MRDRQKEKGQALVEFTLTFFLFLFLVVGIIEVGRLLFYTVAITTAAREGARYGSAVGGFGDPIYYEDCPGIIDATIRIGQYAGVRAWNVDVSYEDEYGSDKGSCRVDAPIDLRDRVVVTVTGQYVPFAGFINLPEFEFSSTSRRTIAKDVEVR